MSNEKTVPQDPFAFQDVLRFDADGLSFCATWINGYWNMVGRSGAAEPEIHKVHLPSDAGPEALVAAWLQAKQDDVLLSHFLPRRHLKHKRIALSTSASAPKAEQESPSAAPVVEFDAAGMTFWAVRLSGYWVMVAINGIDMIEARRIAVPEKASTDALLAGWWNSQGKTIPGEDVASIFAAVGRVVVPAAKSAATLSTQASGFGGKDGEVIFESNGLTYQAIRKFGYWRMTAMYRNNIVETRQVQAPADATRQALLAAWWDSKGAEPGERIRNESIFRGVILFKAEGVMFQGIWKKGYWDMSATRGANVLYAHEIDAPKDADPDDLLAAWLKAKNAAGERALP